MRWTGQFDTSSLTLVRKAGGRPVPLRLLNSKIVCLRLFILLLMLEPWTYSDKRGSSFWTVRATALFGCVLRG
ncbi:hypothetical protein BDW72DRAFT_180079 [Aspergillus terricola var. indicus]